MSLRRAVPQEAEAVATVWLRSRRASIPAIPPAVHTDDEVRAWFTEVVLPTKEVWVADEDGDVAALLVLEGAWVDQLYVDPDHLGRGIGSALLALAKARRPAGLDLWTFQANAGARRFYERHGFAVVDMTAGDNEERAPDVRYEWRPPDRQDRLVAPDPATWDAHSGSYGLAHSRTTSSEQSAAGVVEVESSSKS